MRRKPSILSLLLGQELLYSLLMISIVITAIVLKVLVADRAGASANASATRTDRDRLARELAMTRVERDELRKLAETLRDQLNAIEAENSRLRAIAEKAPLDQPPIIFLSEADGYSFASGSSQISAAFARKLRADVAPRLVELTRIYRADVIEVIGHTDGVPLGASRQEANLDANLPRAVTGSETASLRPYDNVGLGMTRAIAVAGMLAASDLPAELRVIPLSAGSLIARGDRLSPAPAERGEAERRRIEIRVRRSNTAKAEASAE